MYKKESKEILFSIIIPFYNPNTELFVKCLNSLKVQKNKELFEVILVNDGTDLNEYEVLKYTTGISNVRYIYQNNSGVSVARNQGIKTAVGEYILFMDCDDTYEDNAFSTLVDASKSESDLILFNFNKIVKGKKKVNPSYISKKEFDNNFFIKNLCSSSWMTLVWNKAIKRSILKDNDLLFNTDLKMAEDAEFVIRYSTYIKTICNISDTYIYNYVINQNSISQKYSDNIANEYLKSMNVIYSNKDIPINYVYPLFIEHLVFSIFKDIYHPENPNRKKALELNKLLEAQCYRESLLKVNLSDLNIRNRFIVLLIRYKLYCLFTLLSYINYERKK